MICTACKQEVSHATSYEDTNGKWHTMECDSCSGRFSSSLSEVDKIKSRVRMPDGKVLSGFQGMKYLDNMRRAQDKGGR